VVRLARTRRAAVLRRQRRDHGAGESGEEECNMVLGAAVIAAPIPPPTCIRTHTGAHHRHRHHIDGTYGIKSYVFFTNDDCFEVIRAR
jgi:hypothetical protein